MYAIWRQTIYAAYDDDHGMAGHDILTATAVLRSSPVEQYQTYDAMAMLPLIEIHHFIEED